MKRLPGVFSAIVLVTLSGTAMAEVVIATGVTGGTYDTMIREVTKTCQSPEIKIEPSTGSSETIAKLLGNKINAGIVQVDALALRQMSDNQVNSLRTLVSLHPEEVHVVVKANATVTTGGAQVLGRTIGGTSLPLLNVEQVVGKRIGAWGGSVATVQFIQAFGQVPLVLTEYTDQVETLAALKNGEVDAIIAVGGQPLGWLEKEPAGSLRLLAIPDAVRARLKEVYAPATLYYRNLAAEGLPTISTAALLVTRDYKGGTKVLELNDLRECIFNNLPTFQEDVGYHPKWQAVDPENKGRVIPYFTATTGQTATLPKR